MTIGVFYNLLECYYLKRVNADIRMVFALRVNVGFHWIVAIDYGISLRPAPDA
jgi:hypothetical protein